MVLEVVLEDASAEVAVEEEEEDGWICIAGMGMGVSSDSMRSGKYLRRRGSCLGWGGDSVPPCSRGWMVSRI